MRSAILVQGDILHWKTYVITINYNPKYTVINQNIKQIFELCAT